MLFFACGKLGAVHTALNWRLHGRELADLVEKTTPKVLIYSDDFREAAQLLQQEAKGRSIAYYLHCEGAGLANSRALARRAGGGGSTEAVTCDSLDMEDTACLLFTGGTTGLPKGAMISHRMIAWNVLNTVIHDLHHDDVYLCVFPLVPCRRAVRLPFFSDHFRQHHGSHAPIRPAAGAHPDRAGADHGLRRRAHHVPGDDPGPELVVCRSRQSSLLHQRGCPLAGAPDRAIWRSRRGCSSSRVSA